MVAHKTWKWVDLQWGSNLARQFIKEEVVCAGCGREETLVQKFWLCPHVIMVWNLVREVTWSPLITPHSCTSLSQLRNCILDWLVSANDPAKAIMMQTIYQIWMARNDARDGKKWVSQGWSLRKWTFIYKNEKKRIPLQECARCFHCSTNMWS